MQSVVACLCVCWWLNPLWRNFLSNWTPTGFVPCGRSDQFYVDKQQSSWSWFLLWNSRFQQLFCFVWGLEGGSRGFPSCWICQLSLTPNPVWSNPACRPAKSRTERQKQQLTVNRKVNAAELHVPLISLGCSTTRWAAEEATKSICCEIKVF